MGYMRLFLKTTEGNHFLTFLWEIPIFRHISEVCTKVEFLQHSVGLHVSFSQHIDCMPERGGRLVGAGHGI